MPLPASTAFPQAGNLVSRWRLDEPSGNRADSLSHGDGFSYTLIDNNTVTAGTGYPGFANAALFTKANSEYLSIADGSQTQLDLTGSFTIAAWLQWNTIGANQGLISKWPSVGNTRNFESYLEGATNKVKLVVSSNGTAEKAVATNTVFTTGRWYHLTMVYEASTRIEMYVNGASDNTDTSSIPASLFNNAQPFVLGAEASTGSYHDGLMQDVVVWGTALTDAEATATYNLYSIQGASLLASAFA